MQKVVQTSISLNANKTVFELGNSVTRYIAFLRYNAAHLENSPSVDFYPFSSASLCSFHVKLGSSFHPYTTLVVCVIACFYDFCQADSANAFVKTLYTRPFGKLVVFNWMGMLPNSHFNNVVGPHVDSDE